MIREATAADLPRVLEMGRRHHALCDDPAAYDEASMAGMLSRVLADDSAVCLVSEGGSLCGAIAPVFFNAGRVVAVELWWHAFDRSGAALLSAFEDWARSKGAHEVQAAAMQSYRPDAVGRVFRRHGFAPRQAVYAKELV